MKSKIILLVCICLTLTGCPYEKHLINQSFPVVLFVKNESNIDIKDAIIVNSSEAKGSFVLLKITIPGGKMYNTRISEQAGLDISKGFFILRVPGTEGKVENIEGSKLKIEPVYNAKEKSIVVIIADMKK